MPCYYAHYQSLRVSAFNTPLEMPDIVPHDPSHVDILPFNTPLEMLVPPAVTSSDLIRCFQYSIGDACVCKLRHQGHVASRFQYSIGDASSACWRRRRLTALSILHWRCPQQQQPPRRRADVQAFNTPLEMQLQNARFERVRRNTASFNTPLEMHTLREGFKLALQRIFQYSIGDALWMLRRLMLLQLSTFNTPLEMLPPTPVGIFGDRYRVHFQYSIGDAGGSCPWFLWVFKFLCRCVWVSAAGC